MKLSHQDYEHLTVLSLQGDLTSDNVPMFRKAVEERLAAQARDVVLDMTQVECVDSKGLESLLWTQERCGERLGQVRLAGATANVEKILQVTRLAPRFERQLDVDSAIRSLRI